MENEQILDDIWAEEAGVSVRLVRLTHGRLRIELTAGVSREAQQSVTLTDYRAKRAAQVLAQYFLQESTP